MTKQEYDDYVSRFTAGAADLSHIGISTDITHESAQMCDICRTRLFGHRYDAQAIMAPDGLLTTLLICADCLYFSEYGKLDDMTMLEIAQDEARIEALLSKQFKRGKEDALLGRDYGHNNESTDAQSPEWEAYVKGWNYGRAQKKGEDSYAK